MTEECVKYVSVVPSNIPSGIYCSFCYKDLAGFPPIAYTTFQMGKQFEDFFPDAGIKGDLFLLSCNQCCKSILQNAFLDRTIKEPITFHITDV